MDSSRLFPIWRGEQCRLLWTKVDYSSQTWLCKCIIMAFSGPVCSSTLKVQILLPPFEIPFLRIDIHMVCWVLHVLRRSFVSFSRSRGVVSNRFAEKFSGR